MTRFTLRWLIVFVLMATAAFTQEIKLVPISEIIARLDKNKPDPSDLAYVGTRCFVLFTSLGTILEENGDGNVSKELGESFKAKAQTFGFVAVYLNLNINKMSEKSINDQMVAMSDEYRAEMTRGKLLNNAYATPFVKADLASAVTIHKLFSDLEKEFTANTKK